MKIYSATISPEPSRILTTPSIRIASQRLLQLVSNSFPSVFDSLDISTPTVELSFRLVPSNAISPMIDKAPTTETFFLVH